MSSSVYSTPVVANNTLFIADKDHIFAIEQHRRIAAATFGRPAHDSHCEKLHETRARRRPVRGRPLRRSAGCSKASFEAEVVQAHSTPRRSAQLRDGTFDLVLVNRKLDADGSDGLEIIERSRPTRKLAGVPVMLVTQLSRASGAGRRRRRRAGFRQGRARTRPRRASGWRRFLGG